MTKASVFFANQDNPTTTAGVAEHRITLTTCKDLVGRQCGWTLAERGTLVLRIVCFRWGFRLIYVAC